MITEITNAFETPYRPDLVREFTNNEVNELKQLEYGIKCLCREAGLRFDYVSITDTADKVNFTINYLAEDPDNITIEEREYTNE